MNILVAGGAGFIGSHLIDSLLAEGHKVVCADKLIMGKQNIEHLKDDENFKFYEVELADQEKVDVRLYRVIYNAIDDIESAMKGMLDPIYEEKVIGHVEVRQTYKASGIGTIAGSYVLDGIVQRGCSARITRDGEQIFDGKLASLKRFKDDVKEVKAGFECGLVFEGFNDIKVDDQIECYAMV